MGRKNNVWNHYLKDKRRFADLFNGIYFGGREQIRADTLSDASEVYEEAEAEKLPAKMKGDRLERIRDVKMTMKAGACLRILAVENQNLPDYTMPFRCMQYDTMEYGRQVAEIRRKHDDKDYSSEAEKVCRFCKTDYLTPVYTLCLYHGEEPWDGPRTLRDMMRFEGNEEERNLPFADYPMRLFCVNEVKDFRVFHTEIRQLFQILQYRRDKKGLQRVLEDNPEYANMDEDTLEVISVTLNAPKIWEEREKYMNKTDESEGYDMCQALKEWLEEERDTGMQMGMQQEMQRGIKALIEVCRSFNAPWEKALDTLMEKFPLEKEDAEQYMKMYW